MFPATIETARLILRPIRVDDAQLIYDSFAQDPEVTRYLTWQPHTSVDDTYTFVRGCLGSEDARTYVLLLRSTGDIIGLFDLRKTGQCKMNFGYVLARSQWGQGLMTEALREVVKWALSQPAIWRIDAAVDLDNTGSIRVMEKTGLCCEGVLRKWIIHPAVSDTPRDCFMFSSTR